MHARSHRSDRLQCIWIACWKLQRTKKKHKITIFICVYCEEKIVHQIHGWKHLRSCDTRTNTSQWKQLRTGKKIVQIIWDAAPTAAVRRNKYILKFNNFKLHGATDSITIKLIPKEWFFFVTVCCCRSCALIHFHVKWFCRDSINVFRIEITLPYWIFNHNLVPALEKYYGGGFSFFFVPYEAQNFSFPKFCRLVIAK